MPSEIEELSSKFTWLPKTGQVDVKSQWVNKYRGDTEGQIDYNHAQIWSSKGNNISESACET